VCTSWLAGLEPQAGEARAPVWLQRGAIRLPAASAAPLLLVGPGTGIAPFRAFLQERQQQQQQQQQQQHAAGKHGWSALACMHCKSQCEHSLVGGVLWPAPHQGPSWRHFGWHSQFAPPLGCAGEAQGPIHLFFGCRNREGDYLYREEWQQLLHAGVLAGLHTACSRDQAHKVYVTHLIREQAPLVWQLLQQVRQCWVRITFSSMHTVSPLARL